MMPRRAAAVIVSMLLGCASPAAAEVFVRWTADRVPPRDVLGVASLALPAGAGSIKEALAHGYQVFVETDAAATEIASAPAGAAGLILRPRISAAALAALRQRLRTVRLLTIDDRGQWPHIRSNRVTRNSSGVLQSASRSAQPWIDSNAALVRIAAGPDTRPLLTYEWKPIGLADADEGPAVEHYLVAIAEAGSLETDLLLPLHARFQRRILLGEPSARREWDQIRRYLAFYAADVAGRHEPLASIGVVTGAPMDWFEVMNLLARHNLPFRVVPPAELMTLDDRSLKMLLVLGEPGAAQQQALAVFEKNGGLVRLVPAPQDPDRLALDIRRQLGPDRRVLDIFNGMTVIAAPYRRQDEAVVVTLVNYAHQPLPVQMRVPGRFSQVRYEAPDTGTAPVAHEYRNGATEFVVPSIHVGGRVVLTRQR